MGIVSPALQDGPDSLSTCLSVNGFIQSTITFSRSPEAVGVRSPDAASASNRRHVSTITQGTISGAIKSDLATVDESGRLSVFPLIGILMFFTTFFPSESTVGEFSSFWTVINMSNLSRRQ